ncbi:hypothetical protein GC170_00930 [bacterium]|nr:hypothetical protein [bacterium]
MTSHSAPRAPAEDFGVFASPPMAEWGQLARSNRALLHEWDLAIGGMPLETMRTRARADFLAAATLFGCGPEDSEARSAAGALWFMTGHQPELYHPGVWAKNFAVAAVAQSVGGFGGNLVADTDKIKSNAVRVISGRKDSPRIVPVPFDTVEDGRPFEAWQVQDEQVFRGFASSVRTSGTELSADSLLDLFWPMACAVEDSSGARRFSLARHKIETDWGFGLVESPMGLWSETPEVIRLFLAILADLPRFHVIHDDKLTSYRRERKIHSRNHPVADLVQASGWWEAPLWVWRDAAPLRTKLWCRPCPDGSGVELRIEGESTVLGTLPIGRDRIDDDAIEMWKSWASRGIRIRPRALVTTALCRILLTDLFVHGIGGAIYDVLGDAVFGEYFGVRMPRYAVLTATLRLADFPAAHSADERERQIRSKRWLRWQAERIRPEDPRLQELFERKRRWLEHPHVERTDRRQRATQLRKINREIAMLLDAQIRDAEAKIERLSQSSLAEAVVRSREFSIVLHSADRVKRLADKIREMAESGRSQASESP